MQPLDDAAFAPFVPPQFGIKLACEPWERRAHFALRRETFCREQRIFVADDRDELDAHAIPIVAVSFVMGSSHDVLGTVRVHDAGDGLWFGSRLAIDPAYRGVYGLGTALVERAVATARARGCRTFRANVQLQNVVFFERLGWRCVGTTAVCGREHALMQSPLAGHVAGNSDDTVAMLRSRRAS